MIYVIVIFAIAFLLREWLITRERDRWSAERRAISEEQARFTELLKAATEEIRAERESWAVERSEMREQYANAEKEWAKERRQLLNRIQAPEKSLYEDFEPSETKQHVTYDDDEGWWAAQAEIEANGGR